MYNTTKERKERVGRLVKMHANKQEEISELRAGDIAAVIGLKDVNTGDTICDLKDRILLEKMEFPDPVIAVAIEPKTKADQEKMGVALSRLMQEDPTFRVKTDDETGQTIISGMGELHLEIIVDRMRREFNVEAEVGRPQVAYKETITKSVYIDEKYAKQSGGRGQYGHVKMDFEPRERDAGFEFESKVVGGTVPREYWKAVANGVRLALEGGVIAGYPCIDVKAILKDGSYHEVDSSEMAFKMAGSMAVKKAVRAASPVILEPIMKVEVTMPEDYMGDVIGDLNSRRGRIQSMEDQAGGKVVLCMVPLSEMFGYATDLRSKTQGRGNYSMHFETYEEVPKHIAEDIIKARN